jgi:predicted nucleic acid-binding protein
MQDKSGDLPQKILSALALSAFKEGSIDIDELKDMLDLADEADLKQFFKTHNMLYAGGILNLSGSGADIDFAAIALANDLILVTHNVREFSRVEGLRIEDWEEG